MRAATSLVPGLDEIVRSGDPKLRAEAARRIADLFFEDAARLRPRHVDLFDGILIDLVPFTETFARAELAERLSLIANAPRSLVGRLAREHEILVAGPVLRRSPVIDDAALLEIARAHGQGHLLAMSERPTLSTDLTDVILRRGDRDVVRRAAGNAGALFGGNAESALHVVGALGFGQADLLWRGAHAPERVVKHRHARDVRNGGGERRSLIEPAPPQPAPVQRHWQQRVGARE